MTSIINTPYKLVSQIITAMVLILPSIMSFFMNIQILSQKIVEAYLNFTQIDITTDFSFE